MGLTGINFLVNALEIVPQADVLDSMRLFAAEVMPRFRSEPLAAAGRAPC
jgi:hypothetical protein